MVGDAPVFQMKRPGERPAPAKPFCSRKEFKTLVLMVVFFLVVLAYVAWQHAESAISRAEEARRVPAAIEQDPGRAAEPASSVVGVDSPRAADSPGVEAAGPVGSPSDEPPAEAPAGPVHEVMKPKGQEVKPPEGVARKDWIEEWVKKQKADFRPLEDEFEPADKLDADLLGTVIDDYNLPDDTSKIKDEADVFFHVVSFLAD